MASVVLAAVQPTCISLDSGDDYVSMWVSPDLAQGSAGSHVVIAAVRPTRITLDPGNDYVSTWISSGSIRAKTGSIAAGTSGNGPGSQGYNGGLPGWLQIKGVTNGLPQGLPGDTRTPAVLNTAENIGLTIASGSYRLTAAATYNELLFSGAITISATNGPVIFNRCQFRGNPSVGAAALIRATATDVSAPECYDCNFDGGGIWADTWLGPSGTAWGYAAPSVMNCSAGFKMIRCYVHNCVHCLDNPVGTVDQCYMDDVIQAYTGTGDVTHNDVIQFWGAGSSGCQLTNSYLDCYNNARSTNGNTSVIQNGAGWNPGGIMHNVLIDSCLFSHGGYQARVEDMGICDVQNYTYNNNRFVRNATYGATAGVDSRVGWTNNYYTDGALIP
jgi:hypothetical protein